MLDAYGFLQRPVIFVIATNKEWNMHQLDVNISFNNGPLEKELYVEKPLYFEIKW